MNDTGSNVKPIQTRLYAPLSTAESLPGSKASIQRSSLLTERLGEPPPLFGRPTPAKLIETEEEIRRLWENGELPFLTHLEGSVDGYFEQTLCDFFRDFVKPTDWVCASHRSHFVYQLHRGTDLIDQVKAGNSMFLAGPRFISSAIVAGTCSIAVGLAMAIEAREGNEMVFCFLGDAASEHGHALEAIGFSQARNLPVHFIITDNDSSCGVSKTQRRGSNWEWQWPPNVTKIEYRAKFPHAGSGGRPNLKWPK